MSKTITATVINSSDKTARVEYTYMQRHPKYFKEIRKTKKFLVDTDGHKLNQGDQVEIVETKPLSKRKSWKVNKVI